MFSKMSFRGKLLWLCGFMSAVSLSIGLSSFLGMRQVESHFEKVSDEALPNNENLNEMFLQYRAVRINLRSLGLPGLSHEMANDYINHVENAIADYEKAEKLYVGDGEFMPGEKALFDEVSREWQEFKVVGARALEFNKQGTPQAREQMLQIFLVDCPKAAREYTVAVDNLKAFLRKDADASVEAAKSSARITNLVILAIVIGGSAISQLFAFLFAGAIAKKLNEIASQLGANSQELSSASTQIAAASEQLSQASSSQAASIQETSASIEEMNAMVTKSADNANSTASISQQSQEKADQGRTVVDTMIEAMGRINESNSAIMMQVNNSNTQVAGIVKVIEEIGAKTKVINDIVFQTKLLSFNASVEAARAGEHGKGFAVVAEEVGNLAQMSGNAAREIGELLANSTKKVNDIVAESRGTVESLIQEGKRTVEEGVEVANQCRGVLQEIVQNVSSVSSMSGEIASASREQAAGVSEITKAMTQLDQATQQNTATSAECAAAAGKLSEQAENLNLAVENLLTTIQGRRDAA